PGPDRVGGVGVNGGGGPPRPRRNLTVPAPRRSAAGLSADGAARTLAYTLVAVIHISDHLLSCGFGYWTSMMLRRANLIVSISSVDNCTRCGWRRLSWLIDLMWSHMAKVGLLRLVSWG